MKLPVRFGSSLALLISALGAVSSSAMAQQFQEGISGTVDAKRRSPVISFSTVRAAEGVKILVDAYMPNGDYEQYPIRFDLYVNRHLLVSQIRSRELPGPIGATVPPSVATPPFNFSIVATLVHPNRQFSSVAQGAIYPVDLTGTFSCKITVAEGTGTSSFETSEAKATQSAPNRMTLTLAKPLFGDADGKRSFSADLEVTGSTASGTILDAEGTSSSVSGTVSLDQTGSRVQSLDAAGTNSLPTLSCSAIGGPVTDSSLSATSPASDLVGDDDEFSADDTASETPTSDGAAPGFGSESIPLSTNARPSSAEEIVDALLGTAGR